MHFPRKRVFGILALAAWLAGCQESIDCPSEDSVAGLSVRFVRREFRTDPATSRRDTIKLDTIQFFQSISANGLRIPLYENNAPFSSVRLALDPTVDSTVFVFRRTAGVDTVQVNYRRKFGLTSAECNPRVDFSGIVLAAASFRSYGVVRKKTNADENDVEVYISR